MSTEDLPISAETNERGKERHPPPGAAARGHPKEQCTFLLTSEFGSTMQRDWLKFPTMQCSHHQKPSISSALWSDVPAHEQKRGRGRWRRQEKAQESRQGCFWVINKWVTPFGIQTNQPLSPRTSFSHSASVEKTAADQARDYGIGMQQRAAMRFVGGLRSPLSQQSAVSTLLCWAARLHHRNGLHGSQREDCLGTAPCVRSQDRLTHRRGCAAKEAKGDAAAKDPRKKFGTRELSRKSSNLEDWVECESTHSLPLVRKKKNQLFP